MKLWQKSATELAKMFKKGEVSSTEIVAAHLKRIDQINPGLNAICTRIDDQALAAAKAADESRANGETLGPIAGVPFTIKSNIDLSGSATDNGVSVLKDAIPPIDSPVTARMKAAGGIPLARTNLPDLGLRLQTESTLHGLTLNPWNKNFTTGGSSGGEAVALATGMSPLGMGNDLGGSLRNPATCNSIASIKPTFGLVPRIPVIPVLPMSIMAQILISEGPMARNVKDVKLALNVLGGYLPRDPWSIPVTLQEKSKKLIIAMMPTPPGGATDPRVADVVREAAKAIEDAGHTVVEIDIPEYEATIKCWDDLVVGNIAFGMESMLPIIGNNAAKFLKLAVEVKGSLIPEQIEKAWEDRFDLSIAWQTFFEKYDAILTPTWTQLPLKVNEDIESPKRALYQLETARPVYPGNVLGLPSVAVPAGLVDGLPVGVLFTGPKWSDLDCLNLAQCVEDAKIAPNTPIDPKVS